MGTDPQAVALLLMACCAVISWCQELGAEFCLQKGFSSHLMCISCKELTQFHLEPLIASCEQCCHKDSDGGVEKKVYPYAQLIVCGWKLGRYPQVQAFVKSDRPLSFPGLEVKYASGADPIIKLLDDSKEVQETLGIDKWNTDTIIEFLNERLQK